MSEIKIKKSKLNILYFIYHLKTKHLFPKRKLIGQEPLLETTFHRNKLGMKYANTLLICTKYDIQELELSFHFILTNMMTNMKYKVKWNCENQLDV